ncbi:MAG: type II secretion system F family protein [Pseudomonadota bacterium]
MALYYYKAISTEGELLKGELEARDRESLVERLHELNQTPLHIEDAAEAARRGGRRRRLRKQFDLSRFSRDMAILLNAGIPLDQALDMMAEIADEQPAKIIQRLLDDVRAGTPLSLAMLAMPGVFTPFYISMIKASEAAGAVGPVLARLAEFSEQLANMKKSIKSALIYPAILFFVTALSLILLMTYVIPQFNILFEGMEHKLPLPSQIVFSASALINLHGWWFLLVVFALLVMLRQRLRNFKGSYQWDRRVLALPLIGDLVLKVQVSIFARTLTTLLVSGVSLLNALQIVKGTLSNQVLSEVVGSMAESVKEGKGLTRSMLESGRFPRFVVQMVRVGEESGTLEERLGQLAEIYDEEVKTAVDRVLLTLEPMLIIGLGVIIGGVIMAILMAVLSINELAL